jgi:cell division protein FtsI (penicillin-binding protein 3)
LPAESPGKVRKLERWGKTSLPSVAMGQEVSVTTLQLVQAASVIANGGSLVKPRLVLKKDNRAEPVATPVRVIRPETAITMRQMMEGVVLVGSGIHARLAGYSSGGKTGSAQIYDYAAKRYTHNYNGSFMGFAPLTNPAVVVAVTLNGTHGGEAGFGGRVAAPTFKAVTEEALRIFDVPKDLPEPEKTKTLVARKEDVSDLADAGAGTGPNILEDGDDDDAAPAGATVPNFRGKTMRDVLAEAAKMGLTVVADGSGVARMQNPAPGTPLREGERIRVQFAR